MKAIEWDSLDKGYMSDVCDFPIVCIRAIAICQGMIDRAVQLVNCIFYLYPNQKSAKDSKRLPTFVRPEATTIFDVEIRKYTVDMSANSLTSFRRSKGTDDRHLWFAVSFRYAIAERNRRVEFSRSCLIVINAIQKNSKRLHRSSQKDGCV
jgi:hypothetical protein